MSIIIKGNSGGGGASDAFTTIQTDAGTSPVADSSSDTLTLTSPDLLVSGDATTDTVTVSAPAMLKLDGTRAMTGDLQMGAHNIEVGTASGTPIWIPGGASVVVNDSGSDDGGLVIRTEGSEATVDATMTNWAGNGVKSFFVGTTSNHPLTLYSNNTNNLILNPDGQHQLFGDSRSNASPADAVFTTYVNRSAGLITDAIKVMDEIDTPMASISAQGEFTATGGYYDSSATASKAAYFDADKRLVSSATTSTELGYVAGVTSAIQTQLDNNALCMSSVYNAFYEFDKYVQVSTSNPDGWTGVFSGGGASFQVSGGSTVVDGNHAGILKLQPGTTTSGYIGAVLGASWVLGNGVCYKEYLVNFAQLSNATDTYVACIGMGGATDFAATTDFNTGVYFRYTHGTNSGKFEIKTADNGSRTAVDTGITVAANTWYKLRFVVNAAGTSVQAYIATAGGTLSAAGTAITTNIPTSTARPIGGNMHFENTAGTGSGRTFYIDYSWFRYAFTNPR